MTKQQQNYFISLSIIGIFMAIIIIGIYFYLQKSHPNLLPVNDAPVINNESATATIDVSKRDEPVPEIQNQPINKPIEDTPVVFTGGIDFSITMNCGTANVKPSYEISMANGKTIIANYNKGFTETIEYNGYRGNTYQLPFDTYAKNKKDWDDLFMNIQGNKYLTFYIHGQEYATEDVLGDYINGLCKQARP